METTPIDDITGGGDLFFCEPYKCKLLARACVERQAKVALGNSEALRMCKGCADGEKVKARAVGVVVDVEALTRSVKQSSANRPAGLRAPKFNPARPAAAVEAPSPQEGEVDVELPPPMPAVHPELFGASTNENPENIEKSACTGARKSPTLPHGSYFAPTIVSPKPEPPPLPAVVAPPMAQAEPLETPPAESPAPEPRKPVDPKALTREKLERAIVLHGKIRSDGLEEDYEDWFDFLAVNGLETLCLALAAFNRLEPRRAGLTYVKHRLGDAQERAISYIREHPRRTTSEIASALGANYQNIRHTLQALEPRGLIRREHDAVRAAMVWLAASDPLVAKSEAGCEI